MVGLLGWLISFFVLIALLVLVVYQLMCLADLEFDHINPYDSATRINQVIIPEYVTQGGLFLIFFLTGHWLLALLCVPYLYYNIKTYMDNRHFVDVTEIFNNLNWEKKKRLFKIGYLVATLFLSLFWLIWSSVEDDELGF
ncbi:protein cornichon homolog 4-like [Silene latifolia]|uniref:protein cornichon homolog 4-like n=1 Tax=Silene latifolia TaxID=37657 RepID=UPI003D7741D5